jgi:hypothetical protein
MAPEFINKIDWKLLQQQKAWLLYKDEEYADGIINIIDSIQDYAVDELGIDEDLVFGAESNNDK